MKLEELKKQREEIDTKIKKFERQKSQRTLFKEAKEVIGKCYRFRNKYSGESESWYIYATVKDVMLVGSSVYMILDKYEITKDNEIKISLNSRQLETFRPMHCWNWIDKEVFEENKKKVLNTLK
jgi:hypothetical protein